MSKKVSEKAISYIGSDIIANIIRFLKYLRIFDVWKNPSHSMKQKSGNAIRPTVQRITAAAYASGKNTTQIWSASIVAQAINFKKNLPVLNLSGMYVFNKCQSSNFKLSMSHLSDSEGGI